MPMHHVLSDSGHEVEIESYANTMAEAQTQTVGVIGLATLVAHGHRLSDAVLRCVVDISERTVNMVRAGQNPTGDPDVDGYRTRSRRPGGTSPRPPQRPCRIAMCVGTVPTPVTHDLKPDLTFVEAAGRAVESLPRGKNTVVVWNPQVTLA